MRVEEGQGGVEVCGRGYGGGGEGGEGGEALGGDGDEEGERGGGAEEGGEGGVELRGGCGEEGGLLVVFPGRDGMGKGTGEGEEREAEVPVIPDCILRVLGVRYRLTKLYNNIKVGLMFTDGLRELFKLGLGLQLYSIFGPWNTIVRVRNEYEHWSWAFGSRLGALRLGISNG